MCLYPRMILNRKFLPNKKNGGQPPPITDERTKYVPIGCGNCMECRKQKSMHWSVRLQEDIKTSKHGKFVTMTFSDESLIELERIVLNEQEKTHQELSKHEKINLTPLSGYDLENEIAKLAVKRFRERYREKWGKSIRHWLVTELGQNSTERIHIHGILWTQDHIVEIDGKTYVKHDTKPEIEKLWKYGTVNRQQKGWEDNYVTERTINYIVKYINKTDEKHKYYIPVILTSAGIGNKYVQTHNAKLNRFQGTETKETYTTRQGINLPLPIYYRNKIYSEENRQQLWINLLDKELRYVDGVKIDVSQDDTEYYRTLEEARKKNKLLGYGDNIKSWDRQEYEQQRRNLKRLQRIQKANKKPPI